MDLINLELVEFKLGKKGYIYNFVCRSKSFILRKYIKFTVKSEKPNITWATVQQLMVQKNLYIHDLQISGKLHLGACVIYMDVFNTLDIDRYGKDPEYWQELSECAIEVQKQTCSDLKKMLLKTA